MGPFFQNIYFPKRYVQFAERRVWILLVTTILPLSAGAEPPVVSGPSSDPLEYHREFIPSAKIGELARGYLPVARERFEQLLRDAMIEQTGPTLTDATVKRAFYAARLEQDRLVDGRAELEVHSAATGPTLLPLVPCGIPVREPLWHGAEPEPAQAGWVPPGRIAVFAARSATLSFNWSLQGNREASGGVSFPLELPSSIATRLVFEVPAGYRLISSHGILQRLTPPILSKVDGSTGVDANTSLPPDTIDTTGRSTAAQWHRWQLELGGNTSVVVRAVPDVTRPDQIAMVLYHQDTQYDVAPPGVDVTVDLHLRVTQEPLSFMNIEMSPLLTLISARHDDQDIHWSMIGQESADESDSVNRQIQLEFPTALESGQVDIHLQAVTRQDPSDLTRLPRIQPVGLLWQEEMATVNVHLPLEVRNVKTWDCRQFQMTPFGGVTSGETMRFQFFNQEGQLQIQLGPRRTAVSTISGTTFRFGVRTSTAEQQTLLSTEGRDRFEIRGQLHPPWSLDSLTLEPPDLLEDWQVTGERDKTREVRIRLREPLTVSQTARLTLRGRGPRLDLGRTVEDSQLTFIEFPDYYQARSLISAQGAAPNRLQNLALGSSRPIESRLLRKEEQELLTGGSKFVYDVTHAKTRPSFVLRSSEPVYHADLQVRLVVGESQIEEYFVIDGKPLSGELRRLLVFVSGPRQSPIDWELAEFNGGTIPSRQLTPSEKHAAEIVGQGHVWELTLPVPITTDFRLTARRISPAEMQPTVGLLALPQAKSQRGTLVLAAEGPKTWESSFRRKLLAIPETIAQEATDESPTIRHLGSYRYDPLRDALADGPAIVTINAERDPIGKAVWVSTSELRSQYADSGESLHQALYWIEQSGSQSVNVELPTHAVLQRILVNGSSVTTKTLANSPLEVTVQLPAQSGGTLLTIEFSLAKNPLKLFNRITAQPPKLHLLPLHQRWRVWLPDGQWVSDGDHVQTNDGFAVRLLGPLARQRSDRHRSQTVNPFPHKLRQNAIPPRPEGSTSVEIRRAEVRFVGGEESCIPLRAGRTASISVYSWHGLRLASWCCFFFGFSTGWMARGGSIRAAALAASLAANMLLPLPLAPLPAAFFWGLLLAVVAQWTGSSRDRLAPVTPDSETAYFTPALRSLLGGCLGTALVAGNTWATEIADAPPTNNSPTYRVFVPVEQDQATIQYVYLPQEFYRRLIQLSHQQQVTPPPWSLSKAIVSATMEVEQTTNLLTPSSLAVICDLETFQAGVFVQLPISLSGSGGPRSVKVDGREIEWQWDSSDETINFSLAQLGRYQVTMELQPKISTRDNQRTVEITLPPAPDAELRLVGPAKRPPIHIRSDSGMVVLDASGGDSMVPLGTTGRLGLQWPGRPVIQRGTAPVVADQLMWMRVRPGVVTIDALIKVEAGDRLVDRVELQADETLRLLSLGTNAPPASVAVQPGKLQLVQVDLDRPLRGDFLLPLKFLMLNVSGVGSIPVPRLQLVDQETRNRWLAVTVDSSMAYDDAFGEQLPSVSSQIFSQQWGPNTGEPNFAVQLPGDAANLKLSTVYRSSSVEAEESLGVLCRPNSLQLDYHADVHLEDGLLFQHQFAVPDNLQIQHVELWQDQLPIAHRWTFDNDHNLNVFLRQPVTQSHQIRIRGAIQWNLSRSSEESPWITPLPQIDLLGAESTAFRFDVRRVPEVHVDVDELKGLQQVAPSKPMAEFIESDNAIQAPDWDNSDGPATATLTRHATSLTRNGTVSSNATLRCWRQTPSASGWLVTTLRRGPTNWWADVVIRLEAVAGAVDLVRLEVPSHLAKEFEFSADITAHVTPLPDNRSLLEIWPTNKQETPEVQMQMRLPLGAELRDVPDVKWIGLPLVTQYLVLPSRLDDHDAVWQMSHMKPANPPAKLDLVPARNYNVYEVTRHPFRASLRTVETTNKIANITLCDVHLDWSMDQIVGRITYWVTTPPADDLIIDVPPVCEIIEVRVDGLRIPPRRLAPERLAIPLARGQFARRIDMLFTTGSDPHSNDGRVEIPSPHNLKPDQTLWTLRGPSTQIRPITNELQTVTKATQDLYRLSVIDRLTRVPAGSMAELTQAEQTRWYRVWLDRYQVIRRQFTQSHVDVTLSEADRSSLDTWDQNQADIARRYEQPAAQGEILEKAPAPGQDIDPIPTGESKPTWRFVSTGPSPTLNIQRVSNYPRGLARVLLAFALAIGVLSAHRALQNPGPRSWLARSLPLLAVIAGMVICVLAVPSLLGWVVIILAVISSWISSFRSFVPQDSQNSIILDLE